MIDYKAVIAKQKEQFMRERIGMENMFNAFYSKAVEIMMKCPGLIDDLFPVKNESGVSLRSFVPELYEEHIDVQKYKEQYDRLCIIVKTIKSRVVEHNKNVAGIESDDVSVVMEANKRSREAFIRERSRQEVQVKEWSDKLKASSCEKIKALDLPTDLTLETLVPEYYNEVVDKEKAHKQYEEMTKLFQKVNDIIDEYVQEAEKCLSEYQELSSQKSC